MADRKTITIALDTETVPRLDKLCAKLDFNRSQLLRALVSSDRKKLELIMEKALELDQLFRNERN